MHRKKQLSITVVLFFCFFILNLRATDYTVGEILSFKGNVLLDPFGTGVPEPVGKPGKALYSTSIIITGRHSSARIKILDSERTIPPDSRQSISGIIALEKKKEKDSWFNPLLEMLHRATRYLFPGEESVDLISRGYLHLSPEADLFGFREDTRGEYNFQQELETLKIHPVRSARGFTAGEYDFRLGFCYFQLGYYQDAARLLQSALEHCRQEEILSGKPAYYTNSLLLLCGITSYLREDFRQTADIMREFLERAPQNDYTPFAAWLLGDSLYSLDRNPEAMEILQETRAVFQERALRREFEQYMTARQY